MARFICGMNQSLDGYVDHTAFGPSPVLFRHFVDQVAGLAGSVYGRKLYEVMRYWDEDQDDWGPDEKAFAHAWRRQPKWVVSRTLDSVGPNATLVKQDVEARLRQLKAEVDGDIEVAGTILAHSLAGSGLIDEYQLYMHPVVLGSGKPFFAGPRPPLRLKAVDRIDENVVRLCYVPA
ncbi:MAG: dihydrofolate reductase family protein [Telluria sp.]